MSNKGQPPIDLRRIKAFGDKTRVRILELLDHRLASAPELAKEIRVSQSLVNYHLQVLIEGGCVEIAATRERHGKPTRFYTAKSGIVLPAPHSKLAQGASVAISDSSLTAFASNARSALRVADNAATTFALETLTLTAPHHLTAHQALRLTVANLRGLHEHSRQLNIATDALLVPVEVGIAMFETPHP